MMMAYAALDEMLLKLKYTRPIFNKPQKYKGSVQKKIAEKETLVHSHLPPSLPSLNGTRGMGT